MFYTLYEMPGYQNELISKNKYSQFMQTSRISNIDKNQKINAL